MSIQEPERAIDVYEAAMKRNPKDHLLAQKIGQAYIQSHLYAKVTVVVTVLLSFPGSQLFRGRVAQWSAELFAQGSRRVAVSFGQL
jgi:tetratricopeptide repeat protein 21B